jgi:hypothetical protein
VTEAITDPERLIDALKAQVDYLAKEATRMATGGHDRPARGTQAGTEAGKGAVTDSRTGMQQVIDTMKIQALFLASGVRFLKKNVAKLENERKGAGYGEAEKRPFRN